tara:strand:+ start:104 stop:1171 length:1068 start_codon:yes stop_codon:yes gene_type:complete
LERSTAFYINGGAGRVISSIPAFINYEKDNPDDDFIIVCEGGMDFYKGHPTLHKRAFDNWHKNLYEEKIKNRNCISPEPYRVWEYYNQKCSIAQAFDIEINKKGIRDLEDPTIHLFKPEIAQAYNAVEEVKSVTGFDKVIVVQPFGRAVENSGDLIIDGTSRSFNLNDLIEIVNILKKEYAVIMMSEFPISLEKETNNKFPVAQPNIPDIRIWAGIIEIADHFLGCDSVGQHIVKALGGTATVVLGATYPVNVSFPNNDNFDIIDLGENKRTYSPIRLTMEDMPDRLNDEVMMMSDDDKKLIINTVKKRLGKSEKYTGTYTPPQQTQEVCPTHGVVHNQQAQPAQILGHTGKPNI